jgi:hypothetical protein
MNTRKNCPRIPILEDEIQKLVDELDSLVKPTAEERQMFLEQLQDFRPDEIPCISSYDLCMDALDDREAEDDN